VREIKDYIIHILLELKKNKDKDQFELIVKLSKLFKDPKIAYFHIEWWVNDSVEKNIYISEPTNYIIDVSSPENLVDYLIDYVGVQN